MNNPFEKKDGPNKAEIMLQVVQPVVEQSHGITIMNDVDNISAGEFLKVVKKGIKIVKDKFGPAVKSAHEAHKKLKALENECSGPLLEAEKIVKGKMGTYYQEQEKIRMESQRKQEEVARLERERLEKEASKAREEGRIEEANIQEVMKQSIVTHTIAPPEKQAGISYVDNWQAEIVDAGIIPRQYLMPNAQMLLALAKSTKGAMKIEGVRFVNNKSVRAGR